MTLFNFINTNGAVISLATFLIGLFFGNWQAIGRDKRKEFNEAVLPIRINLFKQLDLISQGRFDSRLVSQEQCIHLSAVLDVRNKNKFESDLAEYNESFRQSGHTGPDGLWVITDLRVVENAAKKLLAHCDLK